MVVAKLRNKEEITKGTMLFEMAVPSDFGFEAGQYIRIFLPNGEKRYFSVASSPNQKGSVEIAMRMSDSKFKSFLRDAPLGTEVEIQGPWGDLILDKMIRSYQFVAGGIGITPFMSMLRYVSEEELDYSIELFYFNHDRESTAYYDELEILGNHNSDLTINFIMTEQENNPPNPFYLKRGEGAIYYVVGPPGFVNTINNLLQGRGVPISQIVTESYTGY